MVETDFQDVSRVDEIAPGYFADDHVHLVRLQENRVDVNWRKPIGNSSLLEYYVLSESHIVERKCGLGIINLALDLQAPVEKSVIASIEGIIYQIVDFTYSCGQEVMMVTARARASR